MAVEVTTLQLDARLVNAEKTIAGLQGIAVAGNAAAGGFGASALKMAGFASAAGVAAIAGQAVLRNVIELSKESVVLAASFEKSRMTWGVLVGDMKRGAAVFDVIYKFASKSPLSMEAVNQSATMLKAFGVETRNLIPVMSRLGDLALGDNAKFGQLAFAYGQVVAQNKALTRDLYQFVNAGVPIFDLLQKTMGKSVDELKKITESGAITFADIEKAIRAATEAGGQFYDMGNRLGESTSGKWMQAQDNWNKQLARFGDIILPTVTSALDAATAAMNRWNTASDTAHRAVKSSTLSLLVRGGDAVGAAQFITENAGVDFNMTRSALANAYAASPNPTGEQAAALAAAQKAMDAFINNGKRRPGEGDEAPISSAFDLAAFYKTYDFGPDRLWGPLSEDYAVSGGRGVGLAQYGASDYARARRGMGIAAFGLGASPEERAQRYRQSERMYSSRAELFPGKAADDLAGFDENKIRTFADAMKELQPAMEGIASNSVTSAFDSIGKSLVMGSGGADSFASSMSKLGASVTSQLGSLEIAAGLRGLIDGGWGNAGAWAMLALGGFSAVVGGAWSQGNSNSSGLSSSSSAADLSALTAYYQKTEAFNAQGRSRVLGYASGTASAFGGWAMVGERGPELMRVPRGSQIIPNHMLPGFAGGLNVPGSANVNVIITPPAGFEPVVSDTTDSSGARNVVAAFKQIARGEIAAAGRSARRMGP